MALGQVISSSQIVSINIETMLLDLFLLLVIFPSPQTPQLLSFVSLAPFFQIVSFHKQGRLDPLVLNCIEFLCKALFKLLGLYI